MASVLAALSLLVGAGCGSGQSSSETAASAAEDGDGEAAQSEQPSAADAQAFIDEYERERYDLARKQAQAAWVRATYITDDTAALAADVDVEMMAFSAAKAHEAQRFADLPLDGELGRKLALIRLSETTPGPDAPEKREALAQALNEMQRIYGTGKYCPSEGTCWNLTELSQRLAKSRNPKELLEVWTGWRSVTAEMRGEFERFVELANEGARDMGFDDLGALWRSKYDMQPDETAAEVDRLWGQVQPLYEQLHCYVRGKLSQQYGASVVPDEGAIPAHVLGNMWAQDWSYLSWLVTPGGNRAQVSEITRALKAKRVDAVGMVRYAERFFVSLGMPELPQSFWDRSMLVRPRDREVECHASAWSLDWKEDLRIKMCIEINDEDFSTIHHELGHIYYDWAYKDQPILFADSAHDGFHEALGDTIALSVTPSYLKEIGLVPRSSQNDTAQLLDRALQKVAFLPFGLLVDKWRWQVFSGEVGPENYNEAWWKLREQYQGVRPPSERSESDFDPGAKYHVASNVPYLRYFLAHVLQFQLHRSLCEAAGHEGPLHQCSIYGSKEAGAKLQAMMELGASKPWPEALALITGDDQMDASAMIEYFAPLMTWLEQQNQGRTCGY
nr:M2 family metallopeptidase [Haliangium ochraceum]